MNGPDGTSGVSEPGLDDPALLAEIEAEFAELAKEIQRINAMPREAAPVKSKLLEELKRTWRERLTKRGVDRPEWRERLDTTIGDAVEALLEHGLQENPDGSLGFALRGDVVQSHGGKVMRALLEGFQNMLAERFPLTPPPAPEGAAAAPGSTAPNVMQSLLGVLANAVQKVKLPAAEVAPTAAPAGAPAASELAKEAATDPTTVVQPLDASFSFSHKAVPESAPPPGAAPPAPNAAGQALIQQLIQAFGQAIKPMLARTFAPAPAPVVTPAPPAPVESAVQTPTGYDVPPGTTAASTPPPATLAEPAPVVLSAEQALAGAKLAPPVPPVPPAAAPNPLAGGLAGLGQWLQATLQRGASVSVPAAPSAPSAPSAPTAPAAPAAPTAPPASTDAAPTPAPSAPAPATPPPAPPQAASLNIDFAGLLQSLFKGAKVSVGQTTVTQSAPPPPQAPTAEAAVLQVERERHTPSPEAPKAPEPAPPAPPKPSEPSE